MAVQPHETVWSISTAVVVSRCLHVVAELGVADHINSEPVSVTELAAACNANADGLDRVLRLLASNGVFEAVSGGYGHNEASRLLRSDHPMSMRAYARMLGSPAFTGCFVNLDHSVRTGAPAAELLGPDGFWGYLQRNPVHAEVFGHAMTAKAAADLSAVLAAYDFGDCRVVADIGGGQGHLLRAVLDATPSAHGVLFDLPEVIDRYELSSERLATQRGDFFTDALPSADLYVLMEVIHDWADAEAAAILAAIRRAAAPGAKVLIIENVLIDGAPDPRGHTLDIVMLALTGGRERTQSQFDALLTTAGFHDTTVAPTAGPMRLVQATAT